ncbi:hypothetical protein HDV05_005137 [Chytridiales sp. JEL 0842]|nr:hypothetical protein HDV05_005137 [Chytridiales sp. JEL 0842]
MADTSDTTKIKVEDLAGKKDSDAQKFKIRLPIVVLLTFLLVGCVAAVAIPLGVIAFEGTDRITSTLTESLIKTVMDQTSQSVNHFLGTVADLTTLTCKGPALQEFFKSNWYDLMNAPALPATLTIFNTMKLQPLITSLSVATFPNSTGLVPPSGSKYNVSSTNVVIQPCSFVRLPGNGTCYMRGAVEYKSRDSYVGRVIDSQTGVDLNNMTIVAGRFSNAALTDSLDVWYRTGNFPTIMLSAYAAAFGKWTFRFQTAYQPAGDVIGSGRICTSSFESEVSFFNLFNRLKPTDTSVMFLYDEQGFMTGSSVNGSIGLNATARYSPTDNIDPVIQSVSTALFAKYGGTLNIPFNTTMDTVAVNGNTWVVSTQMILTPYANQPYRLVLMVPRVAFFGQSEEAFRKSLIVALSIAAAGFVAISIIGYISSVPLRRLAASIIQLTKFDFSALENGKLNTSSFVSEINDIEISFLTMVRAFAGAIRKNREISRGVGSFSTTGNERRASLLPQNTQSGGDRRSSFLPQNSLKAMPEKVGEEEGEK